MCLALKSFVKIIASLLILFFIVSTVSVDAKGGYQRKTFVFDPKRLTWVVYDAGGNKIQSGKAVGGKRHCHDVHRPCMTPVGTFHIYSKEGPNFKSSKYPLPHGGASMPWAMFFHKGFAIHGSNEMPNRPASHGCIRVYPSAAQWLSHNLPIGTRVIVRSY